MKQLYVYVTASYVSSSGTTNDVVIWDTIITNATASKLKLSGAYNDYPLFDRGNELRARPITLSLAWDVMPITGYLYRDVRPVSRVRMPEQYCSASECVGTLAHLEAPSGAGHPGGSGQPVTSGGAASADL